MSAVEPQIMVIAVTRRGAALARRLSVALPGVHVALPERFAAPGEQTYSGPVRAVVETHFARATALVLVMAAGIAVRLVGPLLVHKRSDPAVVVVDDGGQFAISLLSGHLGGANQLAVQVAALLDATAVITTASEARGLPVLDLIGHEWGWRIDMASDLNAVTASLVNGEHVGVLQVCGRRDWLPDPPPENVVRYPTAEAVLAAQPTTAIVVSDQAEVALPAWLRRVIYRPPTLVLGTGASSGAPAHELRELAVASLAVGGYTPTSVGAVATLDRKREEPAVVALAAWLDVPIVTYSASELDAVCGHWTPSTAVQQAVGTRGVCEPAALLAAGCADLAVPKQKSAHATVAIARAAAGIPGWPTARLATLPAALPRVV